MLDPVTVAEAAFVQSLDGRVLLRLDIRGEEADQRELDKASTAARLAESLVAAVLRSYAGAMESGTVEGIEVTIRVAKREPTIEELAARMKACKR